MLLPRSLKTTRTAMGYKSLMPLSRPQRRSAAQPLATGNIRHFRALPGLLLKAFRPNAGRN